MGDERAILSVEDLRTYFRTDDGLVKAVDGIDFELYPEQVLGIVGESGSGKSVTALSILKLIPQPPGEFPSGKIQFDGRDLLHASENEMEQVRGNRISMIFQDPMTSLNPYLTVGRQLTEVLELHRSSEADPEARAAEMLELVGIPEAKSRLGSYPHEFSGGMRQRVMIAMALLCNPQILIADEPTTALDVTVQAQILDLINELRQRENTSVILITHDLGVVAGMTQRVAVMYAGRIVEFAATDDLFEKPRHPYTRGLLRSIPRLDRAEESSLQTIPGMPPDLSNLPGGCPFRPRCDIAEARCAEEYPPLVQLSTNGGVPHSARCFKTS